MSIDLGLQSTPLAGDAEICVIGSGGGGAVAAARLAEAGRRVVVLEQGHHWTSRDFTQREEQMLPRLFEEGGLRQTRDGGLTILQGRNVGGSTVHNLCYAFRTPEAILALWRDEHGLPELAPGALDASLDRVEAGLGVVPIRPDEVNEWNSRVRRGTEALGWSGFVTRHNRRGCVKAGYCILGCSYDAKQSMLVTYVPRAEAAGARLYANARAEGLERLADGRWRVVGHGLAPNGAARLPFAVEARAVVVAAGAVASPVLLQRSGLGGPAVGRHLHLHPSVVLSGVFEDDFQPYRGIPQSWYVDEFIDLARDPHRGFILMPITGFPVLSAGQLPGFGREHFRHMRDFSRSGGLLALLHDQSEGEVRPGDSPARPEIRYALIEEDERQLAQGARRCAELLFAAGARRVLVPYFEDPLVLTPGDDLAQIERRGVRSGAIPLASTHPQSTCRMGGDPATSVVDAWGQVHGEPGLYVADMSVFPTSLGAPPQITTAALADRTAERVLAALQP